MDKRLQLMIIGAASALLLQSAAFACGDKLVALGGGVPFERIHVARHPGKVILYLDVDSGLRAANADMRLDTALTRAGHRVLTVATPADLDRAMAQSGADLVVMDWAVEAKIKARLADNVRTLPILYGAAPQDVTRARAQDHCVVDASRRDGARLLLTIEQILEDQTKGFPVDCARAGGRGGT